MEKLKLYFTCALSGLPIEHRERMIALRETLKDSFDVLEFCDPHELTPQKIYRFDIHHNVANADILLAIVDDRGIGLGYEMGVMIEKYGKPVLAVAHRDSVVSPFVLGIDAPNFRFARYDDVSEIKPMLVEFSRSVRA